MLEIYNKKCFDSINATKYNWTLNISAITNVTEVISLHEELQKCTESIKSASPGSPALSGLSLGLLVYYPVIMLLGLSVNISLLSTIVQNRRLRTVTNSFMCSLSVADLLLAVIVIPLKILEFTLRKQYDVLDILFPLLGRASLLNLCAVTIDRYISIAHALVYDHRMTSNRAAVVILLIWLLATFPAGLQFAFQSGTKQMAIYQDFVFIFAFLVPFVSVVFTNGRILFVARKHAREIAHAEVINRNSSRSFKKKLKIIRVIGILVGTFVVSWLPYCILTVYENHYHDVLVNGRLDNVRNILAALACSTAVTNALLYGILRLDVREALLRSLRCQNPNQIDVSITAELTNHNIQKAKESRVPECNKPMSSDCTNAERTVNQAPQPLTTTHCS